MDLGSAHLKLGISMAPLAVLLPAACWYLQEARQSYWVPGDVSKRSSSTAVGQTHTKVGL